MATKLSPPARPVPARARWERQHALAEPNTVVISAPTHRLLHGIFDCRNLGWQSLKGASAPVRPYRVRGDTSKSRFEVAATVGLTPLVGGSRKSP